MKSSAIGRILIIVSGDLSKDIANCQRPECPQEHARQSQDMTL